ncbi:hypothetical protein D3C76_1642140 [compost metagenome]
MLMDQRSFKGLYGIGILPQFQMREPFPVPGVCKIMLLNHNNLIIGKRFFITSHSKITKRTQRIIFIRLGIQLNRLTG